jgi:hypothetical protein
MLENGRLDPRPPRDATRGLTSLRSVVRRFWHSGLFAAAVAMAVLGARLAVDVVPGPAEVEAFHDWDQHLSYHETAVLAVTRDGEMPLWNPYPCGGIPSLGNPQTRIWSPFFLLHLAVGSPVALRWEIALHLILAALGMAVLIGSRATTKGPWRYAPAMAGAALFAGSTIFSFHLAEGHTWILPLAYLPWAFLAFECSLDALATAPALALRPLRGAVVAGALLALMIGEGGVYPAPHLALLLTAYALLRAASDRSFRPVVALVVTASFAFFLAAPKLLPTLEFLSRRPRIIPSVDWLPASALLRMLTDRDLSLATPSFSEWEIHELGAYVGFSALLLACAAPLLAGRRERLLSVLAVVFAALSMGSWSVASPWSLLHELPLFRSQHVPSRFVMPLVFLLAVLAARTLERAHGVLTASAKPVEGRGAGGISRAAAGLLVPIVTLGLFLDVLSARDGILGPLRCPLSTWPSNRPAGPPRISYRLPPGRTACHGPDGSWYSSLTLAARHDVATITTYEPLCPREDSEKMTGREPGLFGQGEPGYRGEAYFLPREAEPAAIGDNDDQPYDPARNPVRLLRTTMNTVSVEFPASLRGGWIIVQQNWDPGWSSSDPSYPVVNHEGRLAVAIPEHAPGQGDSSASRPVSLEFRYSAPYLGLGLFLFVAALLAAMVFLFG